MQRYVMPKTTGTDPPQYGDALLAWSRRWSPADEYAAAGHRIERSQERLFVQFLNRVT